MNNPPFFDIEKETKENKDYRRVLFTAPHHQLVLMSLKAGEEIGAETHPFDQFIRVEEGKGKAILNNKEHEIHEDTAFIVPEGTLHNIKNTGNEDLKIYTVYSAKAHEEGTVHKTKEDSVEEEGH